MVWYDSLTTFSYLIAPFIPLEMSVRGTLLGESIQISLSLSPLHQQQKKRRGLRIFQRKGIYTLAKGIHVLPSLGAHEDVHKNFPHSSTCWLLLLEYVVRHFRSARQLSEWNTVRKIICWRNFEFSPILSTSYWSVGTDICVSPQLLLVC